MTSRRPYLQIVEKPPTPRRTLKIEIRISVELQRSPLGRSRIFRLRPVDVAELIRIAEAMEQRP